MDVVLDLLEEAALLHDLHDELARLEAVETVQLAPEFGAHRRHLDALEEVRVALDADRALGVEDVHRRQPVPLAHLEVVEVMRRRDLDRAGARFGVGVLVGDDPDPPPDQRQDRVLADEVA